MQDPVRMGKAIARLMLFERRPQSFPICLEEIQYLQVDLV